MLKVISGIKNGSHPQTMITIYQSLIRSTAEYGASIFNNSKKTNRKTLQTATNSALRRITGCTRSTPLNTLIAISGQEPIELRHQYSTTIEIIRYFHSKNIVYEQIASTDFETIPEEKLSYLEKSIFRKPRSYQQYFSFRKAITTTTQFKNRMLYRANNG